MIKTRYSIVQVLSQPGQGLRDHTRWPEYNLRTRQFYELYADFIRQVVLKTGAGRIDSRAADDILQDLLGRLCHPETPLISKYDEAGGQKFSTWLYSQVRYRTLDYLKKRKVLDQRNESIDRPLNDAGLTLADLLPAQPPDEVISSENKKDMVAQKMALVTQALRLMIARGETTPERITMFLNYQSAQNEPLARRAEMIASLARSAGLAPATISVTISRFMKHLRKTLDCLENGNMPD